MPCTAGQPAPHPCSCLARQTDTHRAPWGWQRMAGKRSCFLLCFACHAVAASSTQIPSSSSPSLSAKSSPCFLALAPRDQTRGDRTKRKTKGNKNEQKKKERKKKNTKEKKKKREFKNSMIAETVGPRLCPTALLATHTAPLSQSQGSVGHGQDCPRSVPGCSFTWGPSQSLPGEGSDGREDASGASVLAVDESLKALADPPASQPGPRLVIHPQLQAGLPLLAPRCEQEPCSQLCCPWGQLSSAELTPRVALHSH